eukprot:PLAT7039.8.p1 GENE.PLAT7039.8~~PLAT7039.8.p1  ORF type:complete len:514 (+),score=205.42 PLAT7039.8:8-1549(+)
MRELITVQVGQCGNQIGCRFWELALAEHSSGKRRRYDEAMSSFFRNFGRDGDAAGEEGKLDDIIRSPSLRELPVGSRVGSTVRARAVCVDMEEGPVSELLAGPLGGLFDDAQYITDVSGSGNNWAHGHAVYGPQYREALCDSLRLQLEAAHSPQSFFLMHSLGGGTGSGLGSYILAMMQDEWPELYRFCTVVAPSADDDVITSPYNAVLALQQLADHADCVLPLQNDALLRIVSTLDDAHGDGGGEAGGSGGAGLRSVRADIRSTVASGAREKKAKGGSGSSGGGGGSSARSRPFDEMNGIAANLLLNLTSGMRFGGELNVDLNEICTNLVPFPRLHFLLSSLAPLYHKAHARYQRKQVDQMFSDAFAADHQLLCVKPKRSTYLACALLVRGAVKVSDINRNIERIRPELRMIHWNADGFKIGLCATPAVRQPYSLLALCNSCAIADCFADLRGRFAKLYRVKAHVHHYTEFVEASVFDEALESLDGLVASYRELNRSKPPADDELLRLVPEL